MEIEQLQFELAQATVPERFVIDTVFAVRRLHAEGVVRDVFGRVIPIVIHELEYNGEIAMQNLAGNPDGTVDDFVRWCHG